MATILTSQSALVRHDLGQVPFLGADTRRLVAARCSTFALESADEPGWTADAGDRACAAVGGEGKRCRLTKIVTRATSEPWGRIGGVVTSQSYDAVAKLRTGLGQRSGPAGISTLARSLPHDRGTTMAYGYAEEIARSAAGRSLPWLACRSSRCRRSWPVGGPWRTTCWSGSPRASASPTSGRGHTIGRQRTQI